MRREDVSEVAARTAPDAPPPPPTVGQCGAKKASIHFCPYARHRLKQSLDFPCLGEALLDKSASAPQQTRACPPPKKSYSAHLNVTRKTLFHLHLLPRRFLQYNYFIFLLKIFLLASLFKNGN